MHCTDVQQHMDDYLDGALEKETMAQVDAHLQGCDACHSMLEQTQSLLALLKDSEVEPMRPSFAQQAFAQARAAHARQTKTTHRHWFSAGFGGALAAGIVMALVLGPMKTLLLPAASVETISMSVDESRTVNVVFHAPEAMAGVELELVLSDGLELDGRPGQRQLRWQTNLKAGKNRLTVPVRALKGGSGSLVTRLHSDGKQKEFRIQLDVKNGTLSANEEHPYWI